MIGPTQIVSKCKSIFYGERLSIAEHFKFNNRNQHDGETAGDFTIELQAMAEHCQFDTFYDTALRNCFARFRCKDKSTERGKGRKV
jgi:hypothetical protein